jgi:hypothetical protein
MGEGAGPEQRVNHAAEPAPGVVTASNSLTNSEAVHLRQQVEQFAAAEPTTPG